MTPAGSYQHLSAGGMSLLIHGLFVVFLLFGVSWHSLPHRPVEAELWNALPEAPMPTPLPAEPPPPVPATPAAKPEPAKPEAAKPDIALERVEKKRRAAREQALHEQELSRQVELQAAETARLEKERTEKEKADKDKAEKDKAEKLRQEKERRDQIEQELARQARAELDAEEVQLRGVRQRQQARDDRLARLTGEYKERIRSRIRSYLRLPPNLVGNPEVVYLVTLLPNGEVLHAVLQRSSGQARYDQEIERAILRASPLPLPNDRDAAAAFRDGLILKFRPHDDAAG